MALKNPKEKGNNFERKVANMLSNWSGCKFLRTPASGAIHNFNDKRVVSDIVPPLSIGKFPFSIECKCVECSWEFSTLISGTSQTINEHWKQSCEDAEREGLRPMLVFSKNFRSIMVMILQDDFDKLFVNDNFPVVIDFPVITIESQKVIGKKVVIMELSSLLISVSCSELIKKFL